MFAIVQTGLRFLFVEGTSTATATVDMGAQNCETYNTCLLTYNIKNIISVI